MAKQYVVVVSIHCACRRPSPSINTIGLFDSLHRSVRTPRYECTLQKSSGNCKHTHIGLICNSYSARSDISSTSSTINAIIAYQSGKFTAY